MSLHVSMSFPTQINNLPGYTSWDDDTSTLLNIAVSGVTPPEYELDTFCGAEVVVGSNGIPCESSPSASGIRRSSRTLLDSQDLRLAKPAPSIHGAYLKNVSHK